MYVHRYVTNNIFYSFASFVCNAYWNMHIYVPGMYVCVYENSPKRVANPFAF